MEKQRVISRKSLPAKLPIWTTVLMFLLLDRFNAPGWVWGGMGVIFAIAWIVSVYQTFWLEKDVDLFCKGGPLA